MSSSQPVAGKANAAVRKELPCFDLIDRGFDEFAEVPTLLFVNGCFQILNLGRVFSKKTTRATSGIPLIQEYKSVEDRGLGGHRAVPDSGIPWSSNR